MGQEKSGGGAVTSGQNPKEILQQSKNARKKITKKNARKDSCKDKY